MQISLKFNCGSSVYTTTITTTINSKILSLQPILHQIYQCVISCICTDTIKNNHNYKFIFLEEVQIIHGISLHFFFFKSYILKICNDFSLHTHTHTINNRIPCLVSSFCILKYLHTIFFFFCYTWYQFTHFFKSYILKICNDFSLHTHTLLIIGFPVWDSSFCILKYLHK